MGKVVSGAVTIAAIGGVAWWIGAPAVAVVPTAIVCWWVWVMGMAILGEIAERR